MAVLAVVSPAFLTPTNLRNVLNQISINATVAAGMTVVIISGGIDLSVGSVLAFAGVIIAVLIRAGIPEVLAILAGLAGGTALGFVNGMVISKGKLPAFIATLGMMGMARGLALVITQAESFAVTTPIVVELGTGRFVGLPVPILIVIVFYAITHFMLTRMRFGRYVYSIGGNEDAARLSGISVDRHKILIYVFSGFAASIAAIIIVGRLFSAPPTVANGLELDAIAAVIIGGTSFSGGIGSVIGTFVGATIMGVLANGFNLLNVSSFWQMFLIGLIIIVSVWLDGLRHRRAP
jgi:ribose transport system permease protein